MWLSSSAVERIRELESQLRDSVPRAVYEAALKRISDVEAALAEERKEHNRQARWYGSMLLRRADSLAFPPSAEEKAEYKAQVEAATQIALEPDEEKVRAIIEHGKALHLDDQEIAEAVKTSFRGLSEADIAKAINAPNNGHG